MHLSFCCLDIIAVDGLWSRCQEKAEGGVFLVGMTLSPEMLAVILVVAVAGSAILYVVANKKWGYTKKRERELEEQPTFWQIKRKGGK